MADITGMLQAASGTGQQCIAVGHQTTPFISVYRWSSDGFGERYSNPSSLPSFTVSAVAFNPKGTAIALGSGGTTLSVYPWSSSGFGAKYTNPGTTVGGEDVAFNPDGNVLATMVFESNSTRGVHAYAWSNSGFGTKYTSPIFAPVFGNSLSFSPSGSELVVNGEDISSPNPAGSYLYGYSFSTSTGFGTLATPSVAAIPFGSPGRLAFQPNGSTVGYVMDATPYIAIYAWSSTGFLNKFADPPVLPPSTSVSMAWNPNSNVIAVSSLGTPYITTYSWSGFFAFKYSDPFSLPPGGCYDVAFTPENDGVAVAHTGSPYITVYRWSDATGFGTKFSNPVTLPTGTGRSVAFFKS